jgi:hypothetical protein
MNKKVDKKVIILLILVPILLIGLYFAKSSKSNSDEDQNKGKEMVLPDVEEGDSLTKTEIYSEAGDTNKKSRREKLTLDDIYKLEKKNDSINKDSVDNNKDGKGEGGKVDKLAKLGGNSRGLNNKEKTKRKKVSSGGESEKRVKKIDRSGNKRKDFENKKRSVSKVKKKPESNVPSSGLGVYETENDVKKVKDKEKGSIEMEGFIKARFEKDITLKQKNEVVLVVQEDFVYNDVKVNKFALLYGMVSYRNSRFQININTIKNTDNKKYRVDLQVYNTSYQKGIYYDDSQAKEDSREVSRDGVEDATQGVTEGVVRSAVDQLTRSNHEPKKKVNEGDLIYVKKVD